MLTPVEIQGMADRKYPDYLRSVVKEEAFFPLRIRFGKPKTTEEFTKLKTEVTHLAEANFGYTIEWAEKNTRKWGTQKLPEQVRFDAEEQYLAAVGKSRAALRFKENVRLAKTMLPQLQDWMVSHVKWIDEFSDAWSGMLAVGDYFLAYPRPNLYRRELPIAVHTKFIEENEAVLNSLLWDLLPETAKTKAESFDGRFGLKPVFPLVRFRALDPALLQKLGISHERMGLPLDLFRDLSVEGIDVVITENLMNLEALPAMSNTLGVFGNGNAAELLVGVKWLKGCQVRYWGDIDEYGFHILSRLRSAYPALASVMMDAATLSALKHLTGAGVPAPGKPPANLTASEHEAYSVVAKENQRLEQEKVPQQHMLQVFKSATDLMEPSNTAGFSQQPASI